LTIVCTTIYLVPLTGGSTFGMRPCKIWRYWSKKENNNPRQSLTIEGKQAANMVNAAIEIEIVSLVEVALYGTRLGLDEVRK
jgi:hypothetical protein